MSAREGTRFCCVCDKPIEPGEDYETEGKFSSSGVGATIERHKTCPPKPPTGSGRDFTGR